MGLIIAGLGFWAYKAGADVKNKIAKELLFATALIAAAWITIILFQYGMSHGSWCNPQSGCSYDN